MLKTAYPGVYDKVEQSIEDYLANSGQKVGTVSFVNLIEQLDMVHNNQMAVEVRTGGRRNLGANVASKLNKNRFVAVEKTAQSQVKDYSGGQIAFLKAQLDDKAKGMFANLLAPPTIGTINAPKVPAAPTLVLGDADGSTPRMILMAVRAGRMQLKDDDDLRKLANLLNQEAAILGSTKDNLCFVSDLKKYQRCKDFEVDIQSIVEGATYIDPDKDSPNLIYLGDMLYDRLSNNIVATGLLIEKLRAKGAIFIRGNHDAYEQLKTLGYEDELPQSGAFASKPLDATGAYALGKKCFVNAHYDEVSKTLYTHHGVYFEKDLFATAFKNFNIHEQKEILKSPQAFAEYLNNVDLATYAADSNFTEFRPREPDLLSLPKTPEWDGVRQVHGHNGGAGLEEGWVLNVNARDITGKYVAAAYELR